MPVRKLLGSCGARGRAKSSLAARPFTQASYPAAPIRVIIPLAPGGAIDVMVRALGRAFEQRKPRWLRRREPRRRQHHHRRQRLQGGAAGRLHDLPACPAARCRSILRSTRTSPTIRSRISSRSPISPSRQQILILNKNVPVRTSRNWCLFETEPGQAQLRLLRRGRRHPPGRGVAQARDRREDDAHAVQGLRPTR